MSTVAVPLEDFATIRKASTAIGDGIEALRFMCDEVQAQDEVMSAYMTVIKALADSLQASYEAEAVCLDRLAADAGATA